MDCNKTFVQVLGGKIFFVLNTMNSSATATTSKAAFIQSYVASVCAGSFLSCILYFIILMLWNEMPWFFLFANSMSVATSLYLTIHPILTDVYAYRLLHVYFYGQAPFSLVLLSANAGYYTLTYIAVMEACLFVIAMARFWYNGKFECTKHVLPTSNVQMLEKA